MYSKWASGSQIHRQCAGVSYTCFTAEAGKLTLGLTIASRLVPASRHG